MSNDTAYLAVHIATTNDTNGNPRRGWIILDADHGDAVTFVDDGYRGERGSLRADFPSAVASVSVMVTPREYKSWLKFNREQCE